MRVQVISILLCGAALAASPGGESQANSATPAEATLVEAPAEGSEGDKRDKRQWFASGGFNPGFNMYPYGNFNPSQWWGNNYASANFGGRSGLRPGQWQQYMQQMNNFMNNLPPVINTGAAQFRTGARSGVRPGANGPMAFMPMNMLQYMYSNGFAPPFRPGQPDFFQRTWQQYFSQFPNRPQREVNRMGDKM